MDHASRCLRYGKLTTVIMESGLSARAKLLYAILDWHSPNPAPATRRLAALLGCSERAVRYYRKELVRHAVTGAAIPEWEVERAMRGGNGLPHNNNLSESFSLSLSESSHTASSLEAVEEESERMLLVGNGLPR